MISENFKTIARAMVAPGKGILAADESLGTIEKRFKSISLENTEDNRRAYRELMFTTPGIGDFISGVILFDETIRQKASDGRSFVEILQKQGVIPGIKVDLGTESAPESPAEKVTKGLEGLPQRLQEYVSLGARFAKWRAVITIGKGLPTEKNILENARRLAQYAKLCQAAGLVPIVEPEVLMDGGHGIQECREASELTLKIVFAELRGAGVDISGTVLKTNMVLPGKESPQKALPSEIAQATLRVFKKVLPEELPGQAFLSGGQSELEATANLDAINKLRPGPWQMSFSYGRALQTSALKAWAGKAENSAAAQAAFYKRAKLNGAARSGRYSPEMEQT